MKNPRPQLHELKNSGGYEEVADLVLLLHRQKYYNKSVEKDVLEVDVAKQRRGPQNERVGFEFHPEVCRVGKHLDGFDPGRQLRWRLRCSGRARAAHTQQRQGEQDAAHDALLRLAVEDAPAVVCRGEFRVEPDYFRVVLDGSGLVILESNRCWEWR